MRSASRVMHIWRRLMAGVGLLGCAAVAAAAQGVTREDYRVTTVDGVGIHVREVRPDGPTTREPLILVHGARAPGVASFDLDAPQGSLAAELALALKRPVLVMDARGYGGSDRAPAMDQPPERSRPLSRAHEVVRDIDAVVQAALKRTGGTRVSLLGWATGGMWASYYASLWPERVDALVTLNALYGGSDRHPLIGPGSPVADPADPRRLHPDLGGYTFAGAASLAAPWDRAIPVADKDSWRDPAVVKAFQAAALASDPRAGERDPPALRAPLGAIEDSFYQASGRRLFDAAQISARVLVIRSGLDFWSRPEDAAAFAQDAVHARQREVVTLPDATHHVHLDRAEHGRAALLRLVVGFLSPDRQAAEP